MQQKVYVDTSALILLTKINELPILKLVYGTVYITKPIFDEFKNKLPSWIILDKEEYKNKKYPVVGDGEASLFSVALKNRYVYLILDDLKARKLANLYKINFTGTIGVLIAAKQLGYINKIKPLLDKINLTNFRLTTEIQAKALLLAGE
jgi:predicted nucleic acid-binding protein